MDFETCYLYKPTTRQDSRPSKRRRVEPSGLHTSWPLRQTIYKKSWSEQDQRLKNLQSEINQTTISQISTFVKNSPLQNSDAKVASALILTGPSIASHALLFNQLSEATVSLGETICVVLTSALAPNLKTLLKHLIQRATVSIAGDDYDEQEEGSRPNRSNVRLLSYDLQLLYEHVQDNNISRVGVAFQDCEAFDGQLLSEIVELLSCWQDRIPFVFLFGIATSIQDFQTKLSKKATRCIQGRRFDVAELEAALEQAFELIHTDDTAVWVGPGLCDTMLRRQRDHIQSLDAFRDSIHYVYLSHFYANALTVFLDEDLSASQITKDHFEGLRHLPSFQLHLQSLVQYGQTSLARELLDSDDALFNYTKEHLYDGTSSLKDLTQAVDVLSSLQKPLPSAQQIRRSTLVVDALSGQLRDSSRKRTLLLRLRKSNSTILREVLLQLLSTTQDELHETCESTLSDLDQLLQNQREGNGPLRSEEDLSNATLRTTVVAQKVELSKQKSTMTKGDAAYTSILRRLLDALEDYLTKTLIDPKELVFSEIFMYDLKSPHRDAFTPKPRFAIERALAAPHDYLDCECCAPDPSSVDESTLSATQPATAILYQLYIESSVLVNVSDLRTAFIAITGSDEHDEAQTTALFQRSLAELRYLGLVKGTRKKADHIMKMAWRGV